MDYKTKVIAENGKQDLYITREFELPVELLYKAYTEPELLEQWMGTKVLKLENKNHGSYQFETTVPQGNKLFFNGVIHQLVINKKITRTFEFENMPFGVQLEFIEFERASENTSKIIIHTIYESVEHREQQLKLPFAFGLNMAHNRLQEIINQLKQN